MPGYLPAESSPFVGRRRELSELRTLLSHAHVLTLIGTGGVGKTRLALALAADRARAFPDGVWFISADGAHDASLLATHVAEGLGRRTRMHDDDPAEALAASLRDQHLLLVLDNCDQVIEEAGHLVDNIVRTCPQVRVVATSRTPLRSAGDATYSVPPLAMPDADGLDRDFAGADAVRLFLDRAQTALPTFEITDDNRASVAALIRSLDGVPLALELAAVRLRSDTLAQIAERLDSHTDPQDLATPPRHHTMRSSLQWSADLCSPEERRLWGRLSEFRGTFDLDAVEAVCDDGSLHSDVLDLVQALVERSILLRRDGGPVVRYSMLTTIRDFGRDVAEDDPERGGIRHRHTRWYLGLATRAEAEWNGGNQTGWLRALPDDHANIVHALGAACEDAADVELAASAICALWRYFWWARGWQPEGVYWVRRALPTVNGAVTRARLLLIGSLLAWTTGDAASGTAWLTEGQALADETGDELALGLADHVAGDVAFYGGRHCDAVGHFQRALTAYPPEATSFRADTLLMLTLACAAGADLPGAEDAHRETLRILDDAEQFQRSYSLLYVAGAMRGHGPSDRALTAARDALRLKAGLDDPFGVAWTLEVLAEIACERGDYARSATLLGAAGRLWDEMSIDTSVRERLQIHEAPVRRQLRSASGAATLAEHSRRGAQLDTQDAIALALRTGLVRPPAAAPSAVLTAREAQIAGLIARGLTNKQIATQLVVSQRTAEGHVQNILQKLGFTSRAQIAAWNAAHTRPKD